MSHRPTAALLNFLYLTLGHAFYKITGLASLVLLAHWLGNVEFGRYVIALAAAQLGEYLSELGLNQVMVSDAAGRPERVRAALAVLIPVKVAFAFVTVALTVGLVLVARDEPALAEIALYMGIAQAVSALTVTARAVFRAFERMEYEALSVALDGWVRLGATVYGFVVGFGVLGFAKIYAVAAAVVLAATVVVILHRFVRPHLRWPGRDSWHVLLRGAPFAVVGLLLTSDQRVDSLILARVWGDQEVAIFGAAARLVEPLLIVPSVLAVTLFPVAVRHERDPRGAFGVVVLAAQKALLIVSLPLTVLLLLAAPVLVPVVLGPGFARADVPIRILGVALVPLFARIGLAQALLAAGQWRQALVAQALGLGADLLVAAALIPASADVGAAVAVLAGNVVAVAASIPPLRGRISGPLWTELVRPVVAAAAAGMAGVIALPVSIPAAVAASAAGYLLGLRLVRVFSASDALYIRTAVPPLAVAIAFAVDEHR